MINPIAALSPLDGRYAKSVEALRPIFSEYGLMRARVKVELSWLKALAAEPKITEIPAFSDFTLAEIDKVIENFSLEDAAAVKAIEATTNHDVKAIEYWLKERFAGVPEVAAASEFIHFACTSEDINNLSHALMLQEARETVILPKLAEIIEKHGLQQITDTGAIEAMVDEVLANNAKAIEQFRSGNEKALNAIVGQVMKASKGKANPAQVQELIKAKLA